MAEPVQVYLRPDETARLKRLTEELGASKSAVLRRGLEALEREVTDPDRHPALRIIGIVAEEEGAREPGLDVAREHDRYLTDEEAASWVAPEKRG